MNALYLPLDAAETQACLRRGPDARKWRSLVRSLTRGCVVVADPSRTRPRSGQRVIAKFGDGDGVLVYRSEYRLERLDVRGIVTGFFFPE